jgi:hypothetical protein
MYLIIDKKSHAILHMSNALPGEDKKPEELLPGFDPKTMVFGRAAQPYVPVRFEIKDGVVIDLDAPPAATKAAPKAAAETLPQARARRKQEITGMALAGRAALVPDWQMLNAGLGLYDDARVASIKATVNAFRDEVGRLEAAIAAAKSTKELAALMPAFPTALVQPKAAAKGSK